MHIQKCKYEKKTQVKKDKPLVHVVACHKVSHKPKANVPNHLGSPNCHSARRASPQPPNTKSLLYTKLSVINVTIKPLKL